jgi:hypothetical protein
MNSGPLYNWAVGFEEVNSLNLLVSTSTEMSLELLDSTIWVLFNFECPGGRQGIGNIIIMGNNSPRIDFLKGLNFNLSCFPEFFGIRMS